MTRALITATRPARVTPYAAILLDLDGTLLDESSKVHPKNARALRDLETRGFRVMLATGRSTASTRPVLEDLGLRTPAVTFNGAGVWCPVSLRMLEERVLSGRTVARALDFAAERGLLTVLMTNDAKYSCPPRNDLELAAIQGLIGLRVVSREELRDVEFVMRVTLFSVDHASSLALHDEVAACIAQPTYLTHFPLNALPMHRASPLTVMDLHPPCRGKGEGVRVLRELYGIDPGSVIAVGDASNDLPMFEAAGLAVAMGDGMPEAVAAADRVLSDNDGAAIAELVAELFPA